MSRLSFALVLIVGLLAGGLGAALLQRGPAPLADTDVRGIISEMLAADRASQPAAIDPARLNVLIENFLMDDPAVLQRAADKLADEKRIAARKAEADLIAANYAAIYEDKGNVILGNPDGDVTLVEMFDYNYGYCRRALPDMATLLQEDPNLRVILKEFPILSEGSVAAAKVAVLVNEDKKLDYWSFHHALFSSRGEVGADQALSAAEAIGGNRVAMMLGMEARSTLDTLRSSFTLAEALNISGTPTYILGDEVIPGAVGIDTLREKIANLRACGSTLCPPPEG